MKNLLTIVENDNLEKERSIYDNPDTILNQYANEVYDATDQIFKAVVSEFIGDASNEITYALYIIAPKLKDYMYRLIEVNVPNVLQPYPVETTLFAKDPKNNRSFYCSDAAEFRKRLTEFFESPITRVILQHLKTLIDISEQYRVKNFSLTDKEPKKTFAFKKDDLAITVKKIILTSQVDKFETLWSSIIAQSSIKITSINNENKAETSQIISLLQFLTERHIQPVLELRLTLPLYDFYVKNRHADSTLIFELITAAKDVKFDLYYDSERELELK